MEIILTLGGQILYPPSHIFQPDFFLFLVCSHIGVCLSLSACNMSIGSHDHKAPVHWEGRFFLLVYLLLSVSLKWHPTNFPSGFVISIIGRHYVINHGLLLPELIYSSCHAFCGLETRNVSSQSKNRIVWIWGQNKTSKCNCYHANM